MGKSKYIPPVVIALKLGLEKVLEKGVALSTALVQQEGKLVSHFKVSSYEDRCKECMPDNKDCIHQESHKETITHD